MRRGAFDQVGVCFAPSGDVADAVGGGVDSEHSGDNVGDGFGFGFPQSPVLEVFGHVLDVAELDVGHFVDHRLGGMRGGEVFHKYDEALFWLGVAVLRAGQVLPRDRPPLRSEMVAEGVDDAEIIRTEKLPGKGRNIRHTVDGLRLADIEHAKNRKAGYRLRDLFAAVVFLGHFLLPATEDPDATLSVADLSAFRLPCPETSHSGRVGALREDQQQIAQTVGME